MKEREWMNEWMNEKDIVLLAISKRVWREEVDWIGFVFSSLIFVSISSSSLISI